jgi:rhodanese-related sulfurtransferase
MTTIAPADLHRILGADASCALLDVRTPVEFAEVHLPQAHNEPLDALNPAGLEATGRISKEKPVYIVCRTEVRSRKAAQVLTDAGCRNVVVVKGGTLAWVSAGLPVIRGALKVISLERQVRIAAGSLVLAGFLLSRLVHPYFIYLSAFVGAGLVFAGISDWCGMGLLLAKAPWNSRKPS